MTVYQDTYWKYKETPPDIQQVKLLQNIYWLWNELNWNYFISAYKWFSSENVCLSAFDIFSRVNFVVILY